MQNDVVIEGFVAHEPKLYNFNNPDKVRFVTFDIGYNYSAKSKKPHYFRIAAFKEAAEQCVSLRIDKGDRIRVSGHLDSDLFTGLCGMEHRSVRIIARKVIAIDVKQDVPVERKGREGDGEASILNL